MTEPEFFDSCKFRLCTQVGAYLISTVGDLQFTPAGPRKTLGAGDETFFETFVFKAGAEPCQDDSCGCGLPSPDDYGEIDSERAATAGEAQAMHLRYCHKYADMEANNA